MVTSRSFIFSLCPNPNGGDKLPAMYACTCCRSHSVCMHIYRETPFSFIHPSSSYMYTYIYICMYIGLRKSTIYIWHRLRASHHNAQRENVRLLAAHRLGTPPCIECMNVLCLLQTVLAQASMCLGRRQLQVYTHTHTHLKPTHTHTTHAYTRMHT